MTTPDLDHLAALEAAATPGPWDADIEYGHVYQERKKWDGLICQLWGGSMQDDFQDRDNNAAFIAAIRNAAPALFATARNHERLLAAVEAVVNCTSVDAENAALAELATVYTALSGKVARCE